MYMSVKEKHILQNVGSIRNFRIIQYQICKKPWSTPHSNPSFEGSLGRFWDTQLRNRGSGKRIQIFNIQPMPYLREGNGTPLRYSCLENPMEGAAWWAAVHGIARSRTRMSDFTFTFHFHALEKEMATHSSVLAWRIAWKEEPGGLPSMGSQSRTRLKRLSSRSMPYLPSHIIYSYIRTW